ncbi:TIM-barrel domain-containing protein [Flagellimonas sp. 2504JD4-2]
MFYKALMVTFFRVGLILIAAIGMHSCGLGQDKTKENKGKYVLHGVSYDMHINTENFSFSFWKEGRNIVPGHDRSGIIFSGSHVMSSEEIEANNTGVRNFVVTNENGVKAHVSVSFEKDIASIWVKPLHQKTTNISLAVGGMPTAHGLGDAAAFKESFNIVDNKQDVYTIENDGGGRRWVSTFTIFPQNDLASVFFEKGKKTVTINKKEYVMNVATEGEATFYFFLGNPKTIYANYKKVREQEGYKSVKPKSRLFELGWESWDALGWNTNQFTVQEILQKFHDNEYPIRWAVTGSGFWDEGGTTTSFGRWGKKFPDVSTFKAWMHSKDIYWMIGLRTNFIPEGGPYYPKTKKRDKNLKVNAFYGNELTAEAKEKGFLVSADNNEILDITSGVFPIVPSNLLNGDAPGAAQWYQKQYAKWDVDGIKEDTMMDIDSLTNIYNRPITEIANQGGHVMARNGEFVAPGTLLRINDTGVGELSRRIPINYFQYAASGFPNVYSDVAGVHNMHNLKDVDKNIRHTWLLSLTSGLSVGAFPSKWPKEKQQLFKMAIDFHFKIAPYMYSEALKGYKSGYPTTLTPLSIAFPKDESAINHSNFQWMIGESLLATPLLKSFETGKMEVYLPEGIWFDYESGERYEGPTMLKDFEIPLGKTPCFVGGKGILVERMPAGILYKAKIYFTGTTDGTFNFTYPNDSDTNEIHLNTSKFSRNLVVFDKTANSSVEYAVESETGIISFDLNRNHVYEVRSK